MLMAVLSRQAVDLRWTGQVRSFIQAGSSTGGRRSVAPPAAWQLLASSFKSTRHRALPPPVLRGEGRERGMCLRRRPRSIHRSAHGRSRVLVARAFAPLSALSGYRDRVFAVIQAAPLIDRWLFYAILSGRLVARAIFASSVEQVDSTLATTVRIVVMTPCCSWLHVHGSSRAAGQTGPRIWMIVLSGAAGRRRGCFTSTR